MLSRAEMLRTLLLAAVAGLSNGFHHVGIRPVRGSTSSNHRPFAFSTSLAAASSSSAPPQLVEFIEPKTKTRVLLIGTMHYNPTSIKMVQDTIDDLAANGELGSVVVESCEVRWNTTMEILNTPRGQLLKPVLTSEMKAASDKAALYNRPVVLGDQLINITGTSIKKAFKSTLIDLASPLSGGWKRFYNDVKEAADVALPSGPGYLTSRSFFDPRLLIAAPVSFAKYPLSFLARNPISTACVFAIMFGLTRLDTSSAFTDATLQEQIASIIESFLFGGLEFALLGRVMVQVLLAERNVILAKSILNECEMYSKSKRKDGDDIWSKTMNAFTGPFIFNSELGLDRILQKSKGTFYVPSSGTQVKPSIIKDKENEEKVVIAVLGMAHVNGVMKLLREKLV